MVPFFWTLVKGRVPVVSFKGPMPRRTYGFARNHENQWRTRIRCHKYFVMAENTLERYLECSREVSGGKFDAIQQPSKCEFHWKSIMYIDIWELRSVEVEFSTFGLRGGGCEKIQNHKNRFKPNLYLCLIGFVSKYELLTPFELRDRDCRKRVPFFDI